MKTKRLVVGISGSSGAILGIRLLEALRSSAIETHLIVTPSARLTIEQETQRSVRDVLALSSVNYSYHDLAAPIASGSFDTMGMVVIPCSIKSLSSIANSYASDLLTRAADVTLKEGRPLLLVVRETPLHAGHIRLMELAVQAGAVLFPPVPAFYAHPQTLDDIVDHLVGRVLQRMGIENDLYAPWQGLNSRRNVKGPTDGPATDREENSQPAPDASAITSAEGLWKLPAMTLATAGPNGDPHAAAVYFAADDQHSLFFFSAAGSQHSLDLMENPHAAVSIYPPAVDGWQEIRGLQLRGEARPVPAGPDWENGWRLYLAKFPFVADMKEIMDKNTLYVFRPTWIRVIDNRRGFGYKEEWMAPQ